MLKLPPERDRESGAAAAPPPTGDEPRSRARPAPDYDAPGFFEQFARTRGAFRRLIGAHVGLLRAELGEIFADLRGLAVQGAIILGLALLAANMLYVGGFLFLGEWLFGSMGWGLAHGLLLAAALIVAIALFMLGSTRGPVIGAFAVGVVLAVGVAILLASNVINDTASYFAAQLVVPFNTAEAVATVTGAIVVGLLLALALWRAAGGGGAVGGLFLGVVLGAGIGYLFGSRWTLPPAVGFAILLGLVVWIVVQFALAWPRLDPAARFARLQPRQTIETANETREWLARELQARRPQVGRR